MALDLSTLTPAQQIAAIYIGYYDRAADPFGNDFWESALANPSLDLEDIATDFSTQAETLIAYPFLGDPTVEQANAFITEVYLNLFNRPPEGPGDVAEGEIDGLTFWSDALIAAINGDAGALSVGEIILAIIAGAQDVEGGTQDRTTVLNKIEVATSWTDAADAAGLNEESSYGDSAAAQASAKSIIEGVTSEGSTVASAKATIDAFFDDAPSVPGDTYLLTSATDVMTGTADDDEFLGYMQQNPFAGGISNSLSSADRLDGGAGNDRLYAELTFEFLGTNLIGVTDIQPRSKNIETIEIEARDFSENSDNYMPFDPSDDFSDDDLPIIVDAKHITDHENIGSYYSDGDLIIENVTTLTSGGSARNTDAITVTMDHTDNFNSDDDASDLRVLFDNDYLLSGQEAESQIVYFLLDEEAERLNNPNRLQNIDVDGIIFNVVNADGTTSEVVIEADAANTAGTHEGFVAELQGAFQDAIDAGLIPEGSRLFLDPTQTDFTFDDDGNRSDDIPGIVVESGDGTELVATGFSRIEEQIGRYDVYGDFRSTGQDITDQPITVNIDLHKVGRGGEGGDIIVGGKAQNVNPGIEAGIEVFKINVKGAGDNDPDGGMTKPSNVGTITSTGDALREVYISTDPVDAVGDTFASLTVRNGFDEYRSSNRESGDLQLINADEFLGNLVLGDIDANYYSGRITNADMITAQGGGNVELGLLLDGREENQAYTVYTAGGDDIVDILIDGDSMDHAGSSLLISTGGGNDMVIVDTEDFKTGRGDNEQLNQVILDNIDIMTGAGNDTIISAVGSRGNLNIDAGTGNDFINTSGGDNDRGDKYDWSDDSDDAELAAWAFNYDDARDGPRADDLPGVPTSAAYVGGATVTVTLSGAGVDGNLSAGGGVMAEEAQNTTEDGAVRGVNGYEGSATVANLASGNQFWGDQRDVNAAIILAIANSPVLSKLLTVEITENNTLVIRSTTGGEFEPEDLRIEINQRDLGSTADAWNSVESEARQVFNNSGIVIDDLSDANGNGTGPVNVADLSSTFGTPGFFDNLDSTNDWFTGLSARGDVNAQTSGEYGTQIDDGEASNTEQDNVITPGEGNDLTVLSTNAGEGGEDHNGYDGPTQLISSGDFGAPRQVIAMDGETGGVGGVNPFTRIDGNTLQNGASNETLVFEGLFGNDTIMNFTTGDPMLEVVEIIGNEANIFSSTVGEDDAEAVDPTYQAEVFTLELAVLEGDGSQDGTITFQGVPVSVDGTMTLAQLVTAFVTTAGPTYGPYTASAGSTPGTVVFTETTPDGSEADASVASFTGAPATAAVVGVVVNQQAATTDFGSPAVTAAPTTFAVTFGDADTDTSYTFDGEVIPVLAEQTGANIATAAARGTYDNWTATGSSGNTVFFTANATGPTPVPSISEFVGTNIVLETMETETYNAGLDFLDYSDYLTSQYDSSTGPGPDNDVSNVLVPVTLDYNEDNNLGGTGDGATNAKVEANEVAVVRMSGDSADGESFGSISAADVAALFNNGGSYTGFGNDSSYGNLNAADFTAETYTKTGTNPDLIGNGKAIFKVENSGNLGEYKVFELTWSGDNAAGSGGSVVTAREIGKQDYGTSLNGLDDINLVGSDDYGMLIDNGFASFGKVMVPFDIA